MLRLSSLYPVLHREGPVSCLPWIPLWRPDPFHFASPDWKDLSLPQNKFHFICCHLNFTVCTIRFSTLASTFCILFHFPRHLPPLFVFTSIVNLIKRCFIPEMKTLLKTDCITHGRYMGSSGTENQESLSSVLLFQSLSVEYIKHPGSANRH